MRSVDSSVGASRKAAPRSRPVALLAAMRPKQWVKNALVLAAPAAAGALATDGVPGRVGVAVIAFCMLASGTYLVNDVRDAAEDRLHPRKRSRPVAAGELAPDEALVASAVLILGGLAIAASVSLGLLAAAGGYVALTLSYSLLWRHVVILDIVAIAGGFVLRAIGGAAAAPVHLSRAFLVVVTFAALVIAIGKRHAELARHQSADPAVVRRRVLHSYTAGALRAGLVASGAVTFVAYAVWVIGHSGTSGSGWRALSIVPFTLGLLRYGLLLRAGAGEAPDELVFGDRLLLASAAGWAVLFMLGVNDAT